MKPKLAAGVTMDFIHAAPSGAKVGTILMCPLFFFCSLVTTVPRFREGSLVKSGRQDRRDVAQALSR